MGINDNNLIRQYAEGDEKSLEVLIKRYLRPVYNFIYSRINDVQESEDLTQEVFVRMWKNLKKFDQGQKFSTWIFSIAKNASIDFLRKKKVIPFSVFEDENGYNPVTDQLMDQNIVPENNLAYAVEKLSPKYQKIISMHNNDYFTFKQIAKSMGESINTVKSRYRRAIINLKKIIK